MRIMSLNAWGGTLHAELLSYLAETAPDVLCLQEIIDSPETDRVWLEYRDRPVPSRWGLASFIHRSLPVIGQARGFVHKGYEADGFGTHPRSRNAHAIRVFDHAGDRAVVVSQMHGLRDLAGKGDTPERLAQAERFLALTRQIAEPGDRVVMCGDFNVEPDSTTLRLLACAGMTELVTAGGFAGTRTSSYKKPGKFADYMLIDDPAVVKSFKVVRSPEVSDHCPLIVEL